MTITIKARYALHTGGTKFYHVVSFKTDRASFSIRHYGKKELFTEIGKIALGTMEEDESIVPQTNAGSAKWAAKQKDGYTKNVQEKEWTFAVVSEASEFVKSNFASKAKSIALKYLSDAAFAITSAAPTPPSKPKIREPDEPATVKHPEWGSW